MKKFLVAFILSAMLFSFGFSIDSKTPANSLTAKTYSQTYSERSEATNQQSIQKTPQEWAVKNYESKLTVSPSGVTISDLLKPDKVFETNDEWYKLENQPPSAIKTTTEQVPETVEKTVSVFIGKTYAIVNGNMTPLDAPPQINPSGRTYVLVRFIAENLGYQVSWDSGHSPTLLDYTAKLLGIENTNGNVTLEELLGETLPAKVSDNYFSLDNIKKVLPDAVNVSYVNNVIQHINEVVFQVGNTEYTKSVDGVVVDFGHMDVAPYIDVKASRTLVPLRFVAESMGAEVGWDAKERKVTIKLNGDVLNFFVPKMDKNGNPIHPEKYKYYIKNGIKYDMNVAAIIKNSRTFVPIRVTAESFGVNVVLVGMVQQGK